MKHHLEYYCKYDRTVILPAIAYSKCDECGEILCPVCGYIYEGLKYCNECYLIVKRDDLEYKAKVGEEKRDD